MKILMFNNEFPPLGGGTGTVNFELFKIFQNFYNLEVDLITSASGKKKETENFSENIKIFKLPVGKKEIHHASNIELLRYTVKASFAAFKMCKQKKYDLILVWSTVPAGFPAFLLNIFRNIPYIIRIGGPDIPGFEERYKFIYKIISPVIKVIWKKAKLIITKCKTEKEMIEEINPQLQIRTIHNGIDVLKFKPGIKTVCNNLKIICSARLIKRKGQYTLIDAISNLKKKSIFIDVDFVGEGDEKNAYIKYAKAKNVLEQTVFSGYVPHEKMPEKYQNADIFVLPSYNEGMSNALLEAMACGLPVVVTDVGGTEELIDESNGFIFKAGNSNALTDILQYISENKEKLPRLGQNSEKKAENFNWNTVANDYLKIFKDLKS
ncbi:MAG: glycosyltransferase family 4 protein [Chlorobi bacterium]|nr:glycosyltransferase family 4 protein [Chlorobiota bacterium]